MDGYASNTSSMTFRGLKISHPSGAAKYIIGDTDILVTAPTDMMVSGIGDMLAKFVSICEWRIANLLFGEYYCEKVADLVRYSLKKCLEDLPALMRKEPVAVENVFAALTISSVAMNYAGVSRPASGCEHYISHMLDMRGEEFNTPTDFHGTQCATATYIVTKLYEKIKSITPDENRAISRMADFKYEDRAEELRRYLGKAAESMIALEAKEKKFTRENHQKRLNTIIEKWNAVISIINEELPSVEYLDEIFATLGLHKDFSYLGIDKDTEKRAFLYSGDIRDKYVLSRLAMDLGIDKEIAELI
jgi:glycerol-1-phosphate dehydrogenase [NAD(P)+]